MASPTITSFSPVSVLSGGATFTLTVNGTGFGSDVQLSFNGHALATTYVSATQATASIDAAFIAAPGPLPVTATSGSVVSGAVLFPISSALDLCTIAQVKSWLSGMGVAAPNGSDDGNIQMCITAAGAEWLWRTGNANNDGTLPATSPFSAPTAYNEWYDGTGSPRLFVRHAPLVTVTTLTINGVAIPQSSMYGSAGYAIHADGRSLVLRPGGTGAFSTSTYLSGGGQVFRKGIQNINLVSTAGFTAVPPDISLRAAQMVAINYRRRSWIDQTSQAMAQGAGTVRYRDWELPPEILKTMRNYTRTAVV